MWQGATAFSGMRYSPWGGTITHVCKIVNVRDVFADLGDMCVVGFEIVRYIAYEHSISSTGR